MFTKPKNIALLGDSIFDNQKYVRPYKAVEDFIRMEGETLCFLFAKDGNLINDVNKIEGHFYRIVSVGGNDAIKRVPLEVFEADYKAMVKRVQPDFVCTIYSIPGMLLDDHISLAEYNAIIKNCGVEVIDLSEVVSLPEDFYGIEPSEIGGKKIAAHIEEVICAQRVIDGM